MPSGGATPKVPWKGFSGTGKYCGSELALSSSFQIEIEILHLPLRIILRQETGSERARIIEAGQGRGNKGFGCRFLFSSSTSPGFGLVDGDRADDRMRAAAGIGATRSLAKTRRPTRPAATRSKNATRYWGS